MNNFVLKNVNIFDNDLRIKTIKYFVIKNGSISYIGNDYDEKEENVIDCQNKLLSKPFCDYHFHFPGSKLFDLFGLNLVNCDSLADYDKIFEQSKDNFDIIRGFGWDIDLLKNIFSNSVLTPLQYLDKWFPNKPAIIFSLDFHSCWCNSIALKLLEKEKINCDFYDNEIPFGYECILHENIATKIFNNKIFGFNDSEIKKAILESQKELFSMGITEIFSLMFIGVSYFNMLRLLKELDNEKLLKLKIHYAYTIDVNEPFDSISKNIQESFLYESEKLHFESIKVYIDGVVDNHSAYLQEKYNDLDSFGYSIWDYDKLANVISRLKSYNLSVHIHAIGDAAVKMATKILKDYSNTNKPNIIAHIQLCDKETMKLMADNNIFACLQPFWFCRDKKSINIDRLRLGDRVKNIYPAKSLLDCGVKLLFGSDNPATTNYAPLKGLRLASNQFEDNENIPFLEAYKAYCVGIYNGEDFCFKEGENANFILLDNKFWENDSDILMTCVCGQFEYVKK